MNISGRGMKKIVDRMVFNGLLQKHPATGWLQWGTKFTDGEQSSPIVNKVHHETPESTVNKVPEPVNKVHPNSNINTNSNKVTHTPAEEPTEPEKPKTPADLVRERAVAWTVKQLTEFIGKRAKVKFKADPKIIYRLYRRLNDPHYLALVMLYLNHLYDDNDPFRVIVLSFRSFAEKFEQIATSAERSLHKTYSADKDTGGILKVDHGAKIALIWDSAKLTPNGRRILAEIQSKEYKERNSGEEL